MSGRLERLEKNWTQLHSVLTTVVGNTQVGVGLLLVGVANIWCYNGTGAGDIDGKFGAMMVLMVQARHYCYGGKFGALVVLMVQALH